MGSPLATLLADVAMKQFEDQPFETLPRLLIRYVDDTFLVLEKSELDEFHAYLNTLVPEIEFTRGEDCETTHLS